MADTKPQIAVPRLEEQEKEWDDTDDNLWVSQILFRAGIEPATRCTEAGFPVTEPTLHTFFGAADYLVGLLGLRLDKQEKERDFVSIPRILDIETLDNIEPTKQSGIQ
uniref:SFRICE_037172 n=1 Tax=Spodoptera frugiperda TaxID=7108 RepID=A0A2H1W9L9_SPOFR